MRPVRFSINLTLDGCIDHEVGLPDAESHRHSTASIAGADALILGRNTYELMEAAWKPPGMLDQMPEWTAPFAEAIDSAKKYVVSNTLEQVDWNAEIIRGNLEQRVRELKAEPGKGLFVGGAKLAMSLTDLGLIDEYEFIIQPRLVGRGPTLFAGLSKVIDLELTGHEQFASGTMVLKYVPRRT
jgi:dihydrofolate reductase